MSRSYGLGYSPTVFAVILQFVASTAGIALLIAVFRGIWSIFTDRGPRKRVDAIKTAHEAFLTLDVGGVAGASAVADQRDRELRALARSTERADARNSWWASVVAPFRRNGFATVTGFAVAAAGTLTWALTLGRTPTPTSVEDVDPWTTLLTVVSAVAASVTVLIGRWLVGRKKDDDEGESR